MIATTKARIEGIWRRAERSELLRRVAHSSFWSLAGSLAQRGASFASWLAMARLLDQHAFGEMGLLSTTVNLCATLAGLGLGTTATKFVAEWRDRDPAKAGRILAMAELWGAAGGALALLLVCLLAPAIARTGLAAPHLQDAVRLIALIIPVATLNGVQVSALYGLESFRAFARINLATALFSAAAPPLGAWWAGLPGALVGQLVAQGLYLAAGHLALRAELRRRGIPLSLRSPPGERMEVLRFTVPTLLASLVVLPANWTGQSFLAHSAHGYRDLAILTASTQLQLLILFLSGTLGAQILPLLANLDHGRNPRAYRRMLGLQFAFNGAVTAAAGLAAWIGARHLLKLYGEEFARGRSVLLILVAGALFVSLAGVAGKAILSLGRIWAAFLLNAAWAAVLIPLAWCLIGRLGAVGFAWAQLAAYGVLTLASVPVLACALRSRAAGGPLP